MALIEATSEEERIPNNIVDIGLELKKLVTSSSISKIAASKVRGRHYSAEFDTFYQNAEALRQVSKKHSWTRATVSAVARAAVGAGFTFSRHPIFGRSVKISNEEVEILLEPVYNFFYGMNPNVKHIQDTATLAAKMYYTVLSLTYYGQLAWEIIRDENGKAVGFDVLAGVVRPNVDEKGKFLRPAWYFRPWNSTEVIAYKKPSDIVYITWPGVDFSIYGASEYEALVDISIPSDMYASAAYRNHFENSNAPYNGYWVVDKDTEEEDFRRFLITLVNRYSGVVNYGRTPIVIRGNVEFKETRSRSNDDAPYLEGRRYNQEEISAVAAVPSAKLGLAANTTKTNFREQRREFHENTLRPVFEILEQGIYQQVIVREFGMNQWMLKFNSPDLTTALEAATIYARYVQNGVLNVNEVRGILGYPPREDDFGATFYHPSNSLPAGEKVEETLPEDRTYEPQGGSMRQTENVKIPSSDRVEITERQDKAILDKALIDENRINVLEELRTWKNFSLRISTGKRSDREFHCKYIPSNISEMIDKSLDETQYNKDAVKDIFNSVIELIENF